MAWTAEQKAAYIAEINAAGGSIKGDAAISAAREKAGIGADNPNATTDGIVSDVDAYEKSVQSGTPDKSLITAPPTYATYTPPKTDYKIVSDVGKGVTGEEGFDVKNDERLATDAAFRTSELARTMQVIADREAAGEDTSLQQAYLSKINALESGSLTGNAETDSYLKAITDRVNATMDVGEGAAITVDPADPTPIDSTAQAILDLIQENLDKQTESLNAAEQARYEQEAAALQQAYNEAEALAEDERQSAEEADLARQAQISDDRYQESEASKVYAANRGIGNSAQFDAMQRGTISRASQAKLESAIERDSILSDVERRINELSLARDLDLASAASARDYNIATGEAALAGEAFGQQLGQLEAQQERDFIVDEREAAQEYQTEEREASEEFQFEYQELANQFTTEERIARQDYETGQIASQRAYNEALAAKNKEAEWRSLNDRDSIEYEIRQGYENAEWDAFVKETEYSNQAKLDYNIALAALDEDGRGIFANTTAGSEDVYSQYMVEIQGIANDETIDDKAAAYADLRDLIRNDPYFYGSVDATDNLIKMTYSSTPPEAEPEIVERTFDGAKRRGDQTYTSGNWSPRYVFNPGATIGVDEIVWVNNITGEERTSVDPNKEIDAVSGAAPTYNVGNAINDRVDTFVPGALFDADGFNQEVLNGFSI